jgi:hypothetical protein
MSPLKVSLSHETTYLTEPDLSHLLILSWKLESVSHEVIFENLCFSEGLPIQTKLMRQQEVSLLKVHYKVIITKGKKKTQKIQGSFDWMLT